MTTILFLVGSLRADSLNARLARVAANELPEGHEATYFDLGALPFYSGDLEGERTPDIVAEFRDALRRADGVFFTTPEYNDALPGRVKNALDWASRPLRLRHALVGKPMNAAVATISPTNETRSLNDLKRIWGNCGGVTVAGFDFVLENAPAKFLDHDGVETLEPQSLATLRFALANLERLIEHQAGQVLEAHGDAFVEQLT
ncbi:MAG: NAD(P)H-dependent oxidoreductase [Acidobacteria bacterium]|nr:NAD(P)H-dependent oxidoreductase [Acidobacteriota bacterium]